MRAGQQGQLSI